MHKNFLISENYHGAETKSVAPPSATLIREFKLDTAFELWQTAKGARPAPAWCDIDLMQLHSALRRGTMVADYDPVRHDFFVRYWGEDLVRAFDMELSQKWLSETRHNGLMDSFVATAHLVTETLQPQWLMHEITSSSGVRRLFPVLRLPLVDAASGHSHVMTVENIDLSLRFFAKP